MRIKKLLSTFLAASVSLSMVFGSALTAYANEPDIEIIEEAVEAPAEEPVNVKAPTEEPAPTQEDVPAPDATPAAEPVAENPAPAAEPVEPSPTQEETPAPDVVPAAEPVEPSPTQENVPAPDATPAAEPVEPAPAQEEAGSDHKDIIGGSSQKVVNPDYIDAEKFFAGNYDANLCWAATAANMLWGSNFAPNTLNPITGEYFHNEDEVFDYFRQCFTDEAGVPDGAIEYFFNGTYQYQDEEGISQLKEDAPRGGFMPNDDHLYDVIVHTTTADILDIVADLSQKTAGALLKWWRIDQAETAADFGAHWLTIAQVVLNENGGYQGIWLADSDNDPAAFDPQYDDVHTYVEAAAAAASMPNSYTYYELTLEQLGEAYYWIINDYLDEPNIKTYLFGIAYLLDLREGGGGDPEDIEYGDEEEDIADIAEIAEIAKTDDESTSDNDSRDKEPQITQEEIRQVLLNEIKSMMVEKNIVVFSPSNDVYERSANTGYNLVIRRPFTTLANVYINGIRLEQAGIDYTIVREPNGLFTLIINREYMQTLDPGTYTITLEFDGGEQIKCTLIVK